MKNVGAPTFQQQQVEKTTSEADETTKQCTIRLLGLFFLSFLKFRFAGI
jgi:hypothetical protein